MAVRLLYADQFLIVCDKPVGISSESDGLPSLIQRQEGFPVWPVHRLDQTTGGVCILARSTAACAKAQSLFASNQVVKEYLAVCAGVPEEQTGTYRDLLFHDSKTNKTYIVDRPRRGVREASCDWEVLKSLTVSEGVLSLIAVRLHTGRTHQIRVQFASRHLPLVGDRRYGSRIGGAGSALWASRLSFPHPYDQSRTITVTSTPPDQFPWNCFR